MAECVSSPCSLVPLDGEGRPALPGTLGRWLTQQSDILGSDEAVTRLAREGEALALQFPLDWPSVFTKSAALKRLIKALQGTRCRALSAPSESDARAIADAGQTHALHSFGNAERLASSAAGWQVVKGFQLFELADAPAGSAFVALRHWWVARPDGVWVDPTPAPFRVAREGEARVLLVESKFGEKEANPLTVAGREMARRLARRLLAGTTPTPTGDEGGVEGKRSEGEEVAVEEASEVLARLSVGVKGRAEGDELFREGKVEAADACYAAAVAPRIARAHAAKERGNSAFQRGDFGAAAVEYETALAEIDSTAVAGLGVDQCATAFARVLRRSTPAQLRSALWNNAAMVYLKMERYEEAIGAAREALKLQPQDTKARRRRAAAWRALGNLGEACDDLAHVLYLEPEAAETARVLLEVWIQRAPGISRFIAESRMAARKAARGKGGDAVGDGALAIAACRALHSHGTCAAWCRFTPSVKEGVGSVDAARCMARRSSRDLVISAAAIMRKEGEHGCDEQAARALLRLASWIAGVKGAADAEPALVEVLQSPVEGALPYECNGYVHTRTNLEALIGPEIVAIETCRLVEALARRRPANAPRLQGEVIQRLFSFRERAKVRHAALGALTWIARCPIGKRWLESYNADNLKAYKEEVRSCLRACNLQHWHIESTSVLEYTEETGICLGEGGHL
ncbi:hypothetical protein AB1Y20_010107 [Prymnesium parvum]|uniref:peptidylprolyl isomerase n=1 Tax=Prymnesium parvum TaxID=97485 RepID=A0AB34K3G3_PRYPA